MNEPFVALCSEGENGDGTTMGCKVVVFLPTSFEPESYIL